MAMRIFETDDAKYYLGLGCHFFSGEPLFKDVDFKDLDIMVFEDSNISILDFIIHYRQNRGIVHRIMKENPKMGIYGVDINVTFGAALGTVAIESVCAYAAIPAYRATKKMIKERKDLSRRGFLKLGAKAAGGVFIASMLSSVLNVTSYNIPAVTEVYNVRSNLLPSPMGGFRDAVVAKKIAEYLVPKHKQDDKKVQVGILYGSFHSGIETKLKHKWAQDATLKVYHDWFDASNREQLNEIRQVHIEGGFRVKTLDCGLF